MVMDLRDLYETDADFRGYVDRHCRCYEISLDEALEHAIVRQYAERGEEQ